ncbi:MAG TPA: hypothetical protein P5080_01075 [Candidatus Paceibacterota bacterium]|nr:hypothetical protein [Candidatus Pacearchaeota archaeon]HRZ50565.1 hypothetical protein [Candidatus Paceibacterota bacterium]HSA36286.1 hypothetical protein [Candidatus Paceibacterota bacterium]
MKIFKLSKCLTVSVFLSVLFSLLIVNSPVFAVGQITAPIVIDNAMRGEEVAVDLYFVNSDNIKEQFLVSAGGKTAEFTSFYTTADKSTPLTSEFTLAANGRMQAVAIFKIPADIPNGTYTGFINIKSVPQSLDSSNKDAVNVSVGQIISRAVTITVTDQENIAASVSIIPSKYTYSSSENFTVNINVRNESNVSIKPNVHFNIVSDGNPVFDVIYPFPDAKEAIHPGTTIALDPIQWRSMDGKVGTYVASIEVLAKDSVVGKAVIPFTIISEKDVVLAAVIKSINTHTVSFTVGFLMVLALIALASKKFFKKLANRSEKDSLL